jgi:hypothetical protein
MLVLVKHLVKRTHRATERDFLRFWWVEHGLFYQSLMSFVPKSASRNLYGINTDTW